MRFSSQIKLFPTILNIYRQHRTVVEQKEGSESNRDKEDELNRVNSDTESDTIEDVSDNDKNARSKVNPWRDSGYITSDSEDSKIKQIEISDKNQERIASIFWF